MMKNEQIETVDLNVWLSKTHVLKGINITIPKNKLTVIMGPSGCGKTTLLKCFSRLIELSDGVKIRGQVIVDGVDILDGSVDAISIRKKMGLLPQRPYPLPMSIYDNVAYGPKIHGIWRKKRLDEIVRHQLNTVGLWDEVKGRLHEPATGLSIGQQQRLCLARGLAVEPEVILCDESTSALDPTSTQRIEDLLTRLKKEYTIVLVTHTLRQAKRLADNVIFLYMGEVIEAGPANRMFDAPKKKQTRDYINGGLVL
ncbi:MAG: phosphate ABC transporter ATP-binding protein [Methanosarcinaceae archaeon]